MKILVGLGDSRFSAAILNALATQFRPEKAEVRVMHVLQPIAVAAMPEMSASYTPELQDFKGPAHELVEQFASELRAIGFKSDAVVEIGDIRECLLDAAATWHADLIMVGSHVQRGIARFLLGSVAESVVRHARCSVEVVRIPPAA
jgi:nucleotide-binding universal stress UspA family protein